MMSRSSISVCVISELIIVANVSLAQLPTADISRLQPRSARAGESVEIYLAGENLEELTELRFTHPGITAVSVMLPADEFFPKTRPDGTKFRVSVAKEVPPGIYEARAIGYFGYSKSRPFVVAPAESNELSENGQNVSMELAMLVDINSVITGEVASRGVDWFRFKANKGQRVLLELLAERIDSKLDGQLIVYDSQGRELGRNRDTFGRDSFLEIQPEADGEYTVAVSDILYRGSGDHFYRLKIHDQPHIDFLWPPATTPGATGKHLVYGRNLPGGVLDESIHVDGHALEVVEVEVTAKEGASPQASFFAGSPRQGVLPGFEYRLGPSNSYRLGFATAPLLLEDDSESVQSLAVPSEIAGRFANTDDSDVYRFMAKKDVEYCIEAIADRMGSRVDPYLVVHKCVLSADGTETLSQVAENDDMPSFFAADGKDSINADTNDAFIRFKSDQNCEYQVTIIDQFGNGGASSIYRLAIREPTADFQLIAATERPLPSNRTGYSVTPLLRKGSRWAIQVRCPRQDEFEGDIVITAEGLPGGVTCDPLVLSGKVDQGMLVVAAAPAAKAWAGDIHIVGRAKIKTPGGDQEIVRDARFATLVWGHVFADSIRVRSRLTEHVPLSVNDQEDAPLILDLQQEGEWTVEVGQKLELPVKITPIGSRVGNLTIEPYGLWGIVRNPPTINIAENDTEGRLVIDFKKTGNFAVEPGRYMFCLQGTGVVKYRHNYSANVRTADDLSRISRIAAGKAEALAKVKLLETMARTRFDQTQQEFAAADAADSATQELTLELSDAKAKLEEAQRSVKEAEGSMQAAEKAKAEIERLAKAAEVKAVEQNMKFAVWSRLITVNVVETAAK